jgi:hypothetical protein
MPNVVVFPAPILLQVLGGLSFLRQHLSGIGSYLYGMVGLASVE